MLFFYTVLGMPELGGGLLGGGRFGYGIPNLRFDKNHSVKF